MSPRIYMSEGAYRDGMEVQLGSQKRHSTSGLHTHIVPPRSCAFRVTTAAPNQTTKKTAANTRAPCSSGAVTLKSLAQNKRVMNYEMSTAARYWRDACP